MNLRHHHVGCACSNIEKTADKLEKLFGAKRGKIVYDPLQDANLCMLAMPDGSYIELVSGAVVANFVKKRVTYYHICYEVDDISKAIEEMSKNGALVISPTKPAILFGNRNVAFLMSPIGLVELLEK